MTAHHRHFAHHRNGVIEVRVQTIRQLFNSMDPTPFPDQDLDRNAEEFIVGWAMEHPSRKPLEVRVHVGDAPPTDRDEAQITEALQHYFAYRAEATTRKLHQMLRRGRWSLLVALLFLAACLGAADFVAHSGQSPIFQIAREGLVIGGWVAMWRPMEIFLYDWWPLRHERGVYERLTTAKVRLLHGGQGS